DCEADLTAARRRWGASITVIRSGCGEIGVTIALLTMDAAEPDAVKPLALLNDTLDHLLTEARRLLSEVSEADAQGTMLSSEREKLRTYLEAASATVATLKDEEYGKIAKSTAHDATVQEKKKAHAAIVSHLEIALAPVFPDWKERVATLGTGFDAMCHDLVDDWCECRKRVEVSDTTIAVLAADLEGYRATLMANEAATREAEKLHAEKNDEFNKLIVDRSEVIWGRSVGEV